MVLEKKSPDFTDYQTSKKSIEEKEDICTKYAKSYWSSTIIIIDPSLRKSKK